MSSYSTFEPLAVQRACYLWIVDREGHMQARRAEIVGRAMASPWPWRPKTKAKAIQRLEADSMSDYNWVGSGTQLEAHRVEQLKALATAALKTPGRQIRLQAEDAHLLRGFL